MIDEDQKKNYFKKAIPITKVLGKTVAKAGFGWLLKTNADGVLEKIDDALSDGGNDLIDKGVERIFKDFIFVILKESNKFCIKCGIVV